MGAEGEGRAAASVLNERKVRKILGKTIKKDGTLKNEDNWMEWDGGESVRLDGRFSLDELEAIVWWIRNKGRKK